MGPNRKGVNDLYQVYLDTGGTLSKTVYSKACALFNEKVMERIIDHGESFNMGFSLSSLQVVRRTRKHFHAQIDWKESYKRRKEILAKGQTPAGPLTQGEKWLMYFDPTDDEYYVAFYWQKAKVVIQNKIVYRFDATRGVKGNKGKLSRHIKNSPYSIMEYAANG